MKFGELKTIFPYLKDYLRTMRDLSLFTAIKLNISSKDIVFYIKISYLNSRDKLTLNNQELFV